MRTTLISGALFCLLAAQAWAAQPLKADEIVARHVAARGGEAKLRAIQTLRREGRLVLPDMNVELKVVELVTRSGQIRTETTLQGLTAIDAYDGKEGWRVQPFQGRKDPERMSADDARALAISADLDWPFVDACAKGSTLESLGTEDVDGTPAYKLRVTLKTGDQITVFIDPDSWMMIRLLIKNIVRGAEHETETDYGDYERVDGVWVPMSEESGAKGSDSSRKVKLAYEKAEANVAAPDKLFAFPTSPAPAAAVKP